MIENQARKKGIRKVPFSLNGGERGKNIHFAPEYRCKSKQKNGEKEVIQEKAPDVQQHLVAITRNFLLKADTLTQPR